MKNVLKWFGIIALIAVIGFSMSACDFGNDEDTGGNGGNGGGGGAGNSKDNAISVTVGYSSSHTISSSGTHWFKFVGTGEPIIFETEGNVVATTIAVFVGNNTLGNQSTSGGAGSNALRTENTTSGTNYFIRIQPRSGTSGTYTFVVKAPSVNIRTNPISVLVGNSSSHTISSSGQHWFSFQGTGSSIVFGTDSNVVNTNISLFIGDSTSAILTDNAKISFSTISGTTYFIRVTGNSGTYTFKVQSGTGDGTSRSFAIPVTLGYSTSHTFNLSSDQHWFSFLGTGNTVVFETEGNVVATTIAVFIGNNTLGNQSTSGGAGSNARRSENTTLGTMYFIRIQTRNGTSGTYTFVVK